MIVGWHIAAYLVVGMIALSLLLRIKKRRDDGVQVCVTIQTVKDTSDAFQPERGTVAVIYAENVGEKPVNLATHGLWATKRFYQASLCLPSGPSLPCVLEPGQHISIADNPISMALALRAKPFRATRRVYACVTDVAGHVFQSEPVDIDLTMPLVAEVVRPC